MKVTLTFDNGPTPGVTEPILDILCSYDVLATFFVIGNKLRDRSARAVAERAAGEGHWIGNHTLDHEVPLGALTDPVEVRRQIDETEALMADLAHPSRFFRPYGAGGVIDDRLLGAAAVDHLQRGGFTCVLWNALRGDWRDPQGWVEHGIAEVATVPWAVVVLHDLPTGALPRLPEFLDRLGELGAELTHDLPECCVPHPQRGRDQLVSCPRRDRQPRLTIRARRYGQCRGKAERNLWCGFSQGACLGCRHRARSPRR